MQPALHGRHLGDSLESALKAVYVRLRADGKQDQFAVVAVLRKMLALLGALLRDDCPMALT